MGTKPHPKLERLAEKLLQIRTVLGFLKLRCQAFGSQRCNRVPQNLGIRISEYESGKREPQLMILLAYARAAGVSTDVLIDDELDLPNTLLGTQERGGSSSRTPRKRWWVILTVEH